MSYKTVYLDQNATSYPKLPAYKELLKEYSEDPVNLNSRSGINLVELHETIKEKFKSRFKLPSAEYYDLVFTRGATESFNIVAQHIAKNFVSKIINHTVYTDTHVHNAVLAPIIKLPVFKRENIIPVEDLPINFESINNIILVNLRPSFGKVNYDLPIGIINNAIQGDIIVLDASQAIYWGYNFYHLHIESALKKGCEIFIAFSFHKSLGMDPGAGILIRLSNNWHQKIPRAIYGGIGGSSGFDSLFDYSVSNYPAGTFDPRHYLIFNKLMDINPYDLIKTIDPEAQRIFNKIYQFMKDNDAIVSADIASPTSVATFYHKEYTLGELTQRLEEWLQFEEPGSTFIYRTGKFCCNYFFDQYIPNYCPELINLREGCIRLSI